MADASCLQPNEDFVGMEIVKFNSGGLESPALLINDESRCGHHGEACNADEELYDFSSRRFEQLHIQTESSTRICVYIISIVH